MCACMQSHFSCVRLFADPWIVSLPLFFVHGDCPDKNIGVGCHDLLQGIFWTQGSNPCLLHLPHCRQIPYYWVTRETPESQFSSVAQSCLTLRPHGLQHTRPPCLSPTPRAYSNSRLSSQWCHSTISSSAIPFSSHLQSFPASGSFPMSQFFASSGQGIGASASASVLPINIQDWPPLGLTGLIFFQLKGVSRVFSNTTVQKYQFINSSVSSESQ